MFRTTNIASSTTPASAVVRPTFQVMNISNIVSSPSTTNSSWRLTTTTPSVVSILDENSTFYIASSSSATTNNIIRQSPQTARQISSSFTIVDNSNTTVNEQIPRTCLNNFTYQSESYVNTSILERLSTSIIQEKQISNENLEEKVGKRKTKQLLIISLF